jgi:hypothetical protein
MRGPIYVPSPYGMRYRLMVIDHHTSFMCVRFMKSKDETVSHLETIMLDALCHSQIGAFAPLIEFYADSILESDVP